MTENPPSRFRRVSRFGRVEPGKITRREKRAMFEFYKNFAAVYGTCWLVGLGCAFVIQAHVDFGEFGFYGFPAISLFCAIFMTSRSSPSTPSQGKSSSSEDWITNQWVDGRPLRESELAHDDELPERG